MNCTYCKNTATMRLVGTSIHCCEECGGLFAHNEWETLASRWLAARPEDWVGDVAAYLEGMQPERVNLWPLNRPLPGQLPANLVEPDMGDLTIN